jgi:hypothetical protein
MEERERPAALMQALTTEHFVLQTAANASASDSASRASLYVLTLSSALVAMGFASRSPEVFVPFVAAVLPGVFLLGVFTAVRLVDANLEYMQLLTGIARIRAQYRALSPEAAEHFAAERGRWPEASSTPALHHGTLVGFLTTNASMVAFIDSLLGGAGVALLASRVTGSDRALPAVLAGIIAAVALMCAFLAYQRRRYATFDAGSPPLRYPGLERDGAA